jgi:hypothetical protein
MTLQEIIANAQYADNLEFADANGVKFSMADLRSLARMADGEKQTAAKKRAEAERLASDAAALLQTIEEQAKAATKQTPASTETDWRKDPFYQPIAGEIDKLVGLIEKSNNAQAAMQKSLDNASAIYALERMRNQFDRVKDKVKGKTFEELAQQAVKEGVKDNYGLPTLDPIIERLTEPDRMETYAKEKIAEERKKWEQEQAASSASKPGSSARFRTQKSDKPPIAKIEDLNSEVVMNDPDVRAAMEGTSVQ